MQKYVFITLLMGAVSAHASIRPIAFSHSASAQMAGAYGAYPNGPDSYTQGWINFGFEYQAPTPSLQAQPYTIQKNGELPNLAGAYWQGGAAPSVSYTLDVPVWSTPPAADGNWETCELQIEATFALNGTALGGGRLLRFEFETTTAMEIHFSGWYFFDTTTDTFMAAPLDHLGRLKPGRYVLKSLETMFGPGDQALSPIAVTTSLILGPIPPDTDGDRLSDYDEVNTHFTDPSKSDTDGDGLSDYAEIRTYRTSPTNPDTDGDGYIDGFELRSGKSPVNPLDAPAANLTIHQAVEIRVLTKLGKRYRVQTSKDLQVWTDSETVIEGNGQIVTEVFETAEGGVKYWRMREEN